MLTYVQLADESISSWRPRACIERRIQQTPIMKLFDTGLTSLGAILRPCYHSSVT